MICEVCGKKPEMGFNKPHSLHRTKKIIKPNIQRNAGRNICTRCLRTENKKNSVIWAEFFLLTRQGHWIIVLCIVSTIGSFAAGRFWLCETVGTEDIVRVSWFKRNLSVFATTLTNDGIHFSISFVFFSIFSTIWATSRRILEAFVLIKFLFTSWPNKFLRTVFTI